MPYYTGIPAVIAGGIRRFTPTSGNLGRKWWDFSYQIQVYRKTKGGASSSLDSSLYDFLISPSPDKVKRTLGCLAGQNIDMHNTLAEHKLAGVTDHPRNGWRGSFRHRQKETKAGQCLNRCRCHNVPCDRTTVNSYNGITPCKARGLKTPN